MVSHWSNGRFFGYSSCLAQNPATSKSPLTALFTSADRSTVFESNTGWPESNALVIGGSSHLWCSRSISSESASSMIPCAANTCAFAFCSSLTSNRGDSWNERESVDSMTLRTSAFPLFSAHRSVCEHHIECASPLRVRDAWFSKNEEPRSCDGAERKCDNTPSTPDQHAVPRPTQSLPAHAWLEGPQH
eukprot:SAG11_NODE_1993_length_3953_cov_3.205501_4_plen_189_part_00